MHDGGKGAPVLSQQPVLGESDLLAAHDSAGVLQSSGAVFGSDQLEAVEAAIEVLLIIPKMIKGVPVDKGELPIGVHFIDRFRQQFGQFPEPLLTFRQGFLGAFACRDIQGGEGEPGGGIRGIERG